MKKVLYLLALCSSMFASVALALPTVGQPADDFTLTDTNGKARKLSDYHGKVVVLEWFNHECPFVKKHYNSGNMQSLQKAYTGRDVVWLSINSTNSSHSDFHDAKVSNELTQSKHAAPTAVLLDPDGKVGKLYGAKTTPHMFVVDNKGALVYAGAIDDKRSTDPADVKTSKNYVAAALDETMAGKPVTTNTSVPYGCSVKY